MLKSALINIKLLPQTWRSASIKIWATIIVNGLICQPSRKKRLELNGQLNSNLIKRVLLGLVTGDQAAIAQVIQHLFGKKAELLNAKMADKKEDVLNKLKNKSFN